MASRTLSAEQILTLLADAPPHIADLTASMTPAQLRTSPSPGEWSATEVLGHLRSCADVWGDCIDVILAEDRPTIRAINPTTWIKRTDYPDLAFRSSLQAYTLQRADLVARLAPLTPAEWARGATVTGAGKALERTVFFYARWMATHERSHLKQIKRTVTTLAV